MDCGQITFGKYRGLPACDVPIDYLVWAADTMAKPHDCVIDELKRRAAKLGSRDAIHAQAAISSLTFSKNRKKKKRIPKHRQVRVYATGGDCPFDVP